MTHSSDLEARAVRLAELAGGDTIMHITAEEHARIGHSFAFYITPHGKVTFAVRPPPPRPADLPTIWRTIADREEQTAKFLLGRLDPEALRLCARQLESALAAFPEAPHADQARE